MITVSYYTLFSKIIQTRGQAGPTNHLIDQLDCIPRLLLQPCSKILLPTAPRVRLEDQSVSQKRTLSVLGRFTSSVDVRVPCGFPGSVINVSPNLHRLGSRRIIESHLPAYHHYGHQNRWVCCQRSRHQKSFANITYSRSPSSFLYLSLGQCDETRNS